MNGFPETRRVHYIRYLRFYYYHWVDTSAGEILVSKGISCQEISVLVLT